jgi:hypothetical protein
MRHLWLSLSLLLFALPMYSAECGARNSGNVVVRYIPDGVLHRRWAVVADCAHPEWPWIAEEAPWGAQPKDMAETATKLPPEMMPVVRAGSRVFLWKNTNGTRMVLTVTALGPGRIGDCIRVRTESGAILEGKVRGPDLVELMDPAKWDTQ